jgi:DNA polymerase-3 subunit beta
MKITIKTEQLKSLINKFSSFVKYAKNETDTNKYNFLIKSVGGCLIATIYQNYDVMFNVKIDYQDCNFDLSDDKHICLIPLKKFSDLCKKIDCENVYFNIESYQVIIQMNTTKVLYKIDSVDKFILMNIKDYNLSSLTKVNGAKLLNAMNLCAFAMSINDSRSFLNGMLFRLEKDILKLVATDAHRLAYNEVDHGNSAVEGSIDSIVQYDNVLLLQKLINDDDVIEISIKNRIVNNQIQHIIMISCEHWNLIINPIDQKYVDYSRVIPTNNNCTIQVNTKILKKLIDKVSIIGFNKINGINLKFNNENQLLTASVVNETDDEIMDYIKVCGISNDLHDISFNFNYKYLLDFVKNCDSEVFNFSWYDNQRSVSFTTPNDNVYKHVLMPLRD